MTIKYIMENMVFRERVIGALKETPSNTQRVNELSFMCARSYLYHTHQPPHTTSKFWIIMVHKLQPYLHHAFSAFKFISIFYDFMTHIS